MLGDITGLEALALNTSTLDQSHNTNSEPDQNIPSSVSQELDYWEQLVFSFDHDMERESGSSGGNINPQADVNSGASSGRDTGNRSKRRRQAANMAASSSLSLSRSTSTDVGDQTEGLSLPQQGRTQHQSGSVPTPYQYPVPSQAQSPLTGGQPGQQTPFDPYTLAHLAALSILSAPPPGSEKGGTATSAADPINILRQLQGVLHSSGSPSYSGEWPYSLQNTGAGPSSTPAIRPPSASSTTPQLSSLRSTQHVAQMNLPRPGIGESWMSQLPYHQHNTSQPSLNTLPPLDMSMFNIGQPPQNSPFIIPQLPLSSSSHTPRTHTTSRTVSTPSSAQNASRSSSAPSTPVSPAASTSRTAPLMDEAAITEDKRRRNTAASARFRIKKKHKTLALERSVVELEARAEDLDREVTELRRENGWLKEMLIMKGRSLRTSSLSSSSTSDAGPSVSTPQRAVNVEGDEDDEESSEGESGSDREREMSVDEAGSQSTKETQSKDLKGKGKAL